MKLKLILKKSYDGLNVLNKEYFEVNELDINVKNDFDILNPILFLYGRGLEKFNYFEIPELKRCYHVANVESLSGGLFKIFGVTDVLETFKTDILKSEVSFYRKLRDGDFFNGAIDYSVLTDVNYYSSDVVLDSSDNSMILSTVGADRGI